MFPSNISFDQARYQIDLLPTQMIKLTLLLPYSTGLRYGPIPLENLET